MKHYMSRLASAGVLALMLIAFGSAIAEAQGGTNWSQDRGFHLGLQFVGNFVGADDPGPSSPPNALFVEEGGGGAMLLVGYTFTPHFRLRFVGGSAQHNTNQSGVEVLHSTATLEAHYQFTPAGRARPYVFGGLGGSDLRTDQQGFRVETSGGTAVIGTGLLFNITRHLVADLTLRYDSINFNTVEVTFEQPGGTTQLSSDIEENGSAAKLLFGLLWAF